MTHPCSGIILAGGLSTRFNGRNKALIEIDGRSVLDRLLDVFTGRFDEIILVTNDPLTYLARDVIIVSDLFDARSSLTGIHSGLVAASRPRAFVSACDTPFLKGPLVDRLLEEVDDTCDLVIPKVAAGDEPLCAVYSTKCLKAIANQLKQGVYKIAKFFNQVRVKRVPEEILRPLDPELASFFNINTLEDLERAESARESA